MQTDEDAKMLALSVIAHRSRLAIFRMLVAVGSRGMPAGEISARLGMVRSSLSFHLKDMLQANLVSARREGTFIFYSAVLDTVHGVIDFLTEHCLACPTGVFPPGEKAAISRVRMSGSAEGAVTNEVSR
ncbi:ArsR/SmtB family transcription factor [Paraburkholderia bryophila]|uniref:DNA-binding transcriptional ArsR family regulator n=1 Tax=Paraburkholderia bryophila TaxID=420952 RepID=A0A329BVD1_9BURK|nr:metalloregulator ArsR/SmtB family transcription factor [Paraburkholderia bryophila]RAS25817.1 DNA-binding transcriptional ArsR family regulator [Paraburkholderia bryophila]